jgi:hypothetical protein
MNADETLGAKGKTGKRRNGNKRRKRDGTRIITNGG